LDGRDERATEGRTDPFLHEEKVEPLGGSRGGGREELAKENENLRIGGDEVMSWSGVSSKRC
jgi:hypothetical protein